MGLLSNDSKRKPEIDGYGLAPTKPLLLAMAAADTALMRRNELKAKLGDAEKERRTAAADVEALRASMVDARPEETAKTFNQKKSRLELAETRIEEIRKELASNGAELKQRHAELDEAREAWARSAIAAMEKSFRAAAEAFSAEFRKLMALGVAVGDPDMLILRAAKEAVVYWPGNRSNVLTLKSRVFNEAGGERCTGGWEEEPAWRTDAEAAAVFEKHRAPLELQKRLYNAVGDLAEEAR